MFYVNGIFNKKSVVICGLQVCTGSDQASLLWRAVLVSNLIILQSNLFFSTDNSIHDGHFE